MSSRCNDCCHPGGTNPEACGCCEGIGIVTPLPIRNRPGLSELAYRIGSHSSFMETMTARLSGTDYPALAGLTTRDASDASLALLDSWATVADVLTFYQERIANEGYLRTATERRSVLELANLVGYTLRPGVSASVFLAYTIDDNTKGEVTVPRGSKAQSIPGPGELPQLFETSADITARAAWNNLQPRLSQPQTSNTVKKGVQDSLVKGPRVYLKGINTNLKPNDPLLIDFGYVGVKPEFSRVIAVYPDAAADRTLVTLSLDESVEENGDVTVNGELRTEPEQSSLTVRRAETQLVKELAQRPSIQPRNALKLPRTLQEQFSEGANTGYEVVSAFAPELRATLSSAFGNATFTASSNLKVYVLRTRASLFGHNAPREPHYEPILLEGSERPNPNAGNLAPQSSWEEWQVDRTDEVADVLYLDKVYQDILPSTNIWVEASDGTGRLFNSERVETISRYAYGISGEITRITLEEGWWDPPIGDNGNKDTYIEKLRTTKIYAQPEQLELAEEPIEAPVCGGREDLIELDGFYEGLDSGRWVVVSGERELAGTSGVRFSELAMLSSVTQDVVNTEAGSSISTNVNEDKPRAGEKIHTFVKLAEKLAYCFKRDTVTLHGNVVKATHGESHHEVLGSGNGSKALQSFELKQKPLTFVAAANPSGVDSTLEVMVNGIRWHQVETLADRRPTDRNFITSTDNDDNTTLVFGNGEKGARLPTGVENIEAQYRSGIGKPGNVPAEQISLLQSKPLGVKAVINPLQASGGANREGRDQARRNAPLAIKALDRLVSVQDYEDFSRTYAGIGKARAVELSDGRRHLVHVTIAGAEDIPIDENSDLFQNLRQALHDFGDPHQAIELAVRELMLMVVSARVRILPDHQWETVVSSLRNTLLEAFSFERRELGQPVLLSQVISVMQSVAGVAYVDVDVLGGIPEKVSGALERRPLTPREIAETVQNIVGESTEINRPEQAIRVNQAAREEGVIRPAQIAFLTPDVPETLILNRIE